MHSKWVLLIIYCLYLRNVRRANRLMHTVIVPVRRRRQWGGKHHYRNIYFQATICWKYNAIKKRNCLNSIIAIKVLVKEKKKAYHNDHFRYHIFFERDTRGLLHTRCSHRFLVEIPAKIHFSSRQIIVGTKMSSEQWWNTNITPECNLKWFTVIAPCKNRFSCRRSSLNDVKLVDASIARSQDTDAWVIFLSILLLHRGVEVAR